MRLTLMVRRLLREGILRWVMVLAVAFSLSCSQDTSWEASMAAGKRAAARGDYAAAERNLSGAIAKAERFGLEDLRVAQALSELGQVYVAQGKFVEAEPLYVRALAIYQTARGDLHMDVAVIANNLGILHKKHGQYAAAEPYLVRALSIKERLLGPDHAEVAVSLGTLAQLYMAEERYEQAEPLLRRAAAIRERGPDKSAFTKSLEQHEAVLRKMGRLPSP